jgi:hypothetical protein
VTAQIEVRPGDIVDSSFCARLESFLSMPALASVGRPAIFLKTE